MAVDDQDLNETEVDPTLPDLDDLASLDSQSLEASPIETLQAEVAEAKDRYLRLLAEFDNFKKRSAKERSDLLKYQGERIFIDLLEVVDNFELAIQNSGSDFDKFKEGIALIHKKFVVFLEKWDVVGEPGIGKMFDPMKHSALSKVPGSDATPGTIVGELKKAYYYKDRLLRPGEVVVADESPAVGSTSEPALD